MGLVDGVPHLLKTEGVSGLYSGLASTCMKQGGNQGSRFFYMAQWRLLVGGDAEAKLRGRAASPLSFFFNEADRDRDRRFRPKHLTFAGGLGAGLFSVLCTSPFDIVKTRMQSTEAKNYARARRARRSGPARKPPRRSDVEGAKHRAQVHRRLLQADRDQGGPEGLLQRRPRAVRARRPRPGHHLPLRRPRLRRHRREGRDLVVVTSQKKTTDDARPGLLPGLGRLAVAGGDVGAHGGERGSVADGEDLRGEETHPLAEGRDATARDARPSWRRQPKSPNERASGAGAGRRRCRGRGRRSVRRRRRGQAPGGPRRASSPSSGARGWARGGAAG